MKIAIIVALSENNVIGKNNRLPWHISEELRYFKSVTMGKPIIMGRKTFDSLKKPLPDRVNIVLTRSTSWHHDGVIKVSNLDQAFREAKKANRESDSEIMVIGGENIYQQALPYCDRLYLTRIHKTFDGDTFFPSIDQTIWQTTSKQDKQAQDGDQTLEYSLLILDRVTV